MFAKHAVVIQLHLTSCRARGLRPASIHLRAQVLGRLERDLGVALEHATATMLEDWLAGLDVSLSSRRTYLKQLRGFYRWAQDAGVVARDPTAGIDLPAEPRRVPRPIPWNDVDAALRLAPRPVSTWYTLAAYAGLRCCEISAVRGEDLVDGVLYVLEGKGGRQRMIPAHDRLVDAMADHPAVGRLWSQTPGAVSLEGNRWLRRLGVAGTMHRLRHSFGTGVYASSGDLFATQQLLGHASPTTTQVYVAVARDRLAAAVAGLPG